MKLIYSQQSVMEKGKARRKLSEWFAVRGLGFAITYI